MTDKKQNSRIVNPWLGVLVVLAVLIAFNVVAKSIRLRADLTAEKAFTLSDETKAYLGNLAKPVTLKFYSSRGNHVPAQLKQYLQRTVDLLKEMERASKGKVVLELYDPQPDSDEEEWAQRYGVAGQPISPLDMDSMLYMGLVAVSGAQESTIPVLSPAAEAQLEYNVSRLIHEVTRTAKPKVGIMSSLPVVGSPRMPSMRRQDDTSWLAIRELRRYYDVVSVAPDATEIPTNVTALVVIHPKTVGEGTLYALDQFVMRGGRLVVLEDPLSLTDRNLSPDMSGMGMMAGWSSDLNRLTSAWGAEMKAAEVVADPASASPVSMGMGQAENMPTWLSLREDRINRDDALTASLRMLMMPFAGGFDLKPVEGVTATPLVSLSDAGSVISAFTATMPGPEKMRDATPAASLPLVVRLHGRFPSAFSNTPPAATAPGDTRAPHLASAESDAVVILIGDVDFLFDAHAFNTMNLLGQTVAELANDNFGLFIGAIEQATGSDELIGVRSRRVEDRVFTRVLKLQEAAQLQWQAEELKLMDRLQEAQRRLSELQNARSDDQKMIITPEQKAEIENFRKVRFETQRELKNVRRNLRKDIESLGLQVKAVNVAAVPVLVVLFGVARGLRRRRG